MRRTLKKNKGLSPLVAAIILIALVIAGAVIVYALFTTLFTAQSKILQVQITSAFISKVGASQALAGVSVKNVGTSAVASCTATFYDDNGRSFALGLGPMNPGETVSATNMTPPGVPYAFEDSTDYPLVVVATKGGGSNESYSTSLTVTCGESAAATSFETKSIVFELVGMNSYTPNGTVLTVDDERFTFEDVQAGLAAFNWTVGTQHFFRVV